MPKNLLADLLAIAKAARAAKNLQRGVTRAAHRSLRRVAEGQHRRSLAEPQRNTFSGRRRYATELHEVKRVFDEFARRHLHDWRRVRAGGAPVGDGYRLHFTYQAKPRLGVTLRPRSLFARAFEGVEANENSRYNFGREKVDYLYLAEIEIIATPHCVEVRYETTEVIDPYMNCQRDLTRQYEAPSMPSGFGLIGERFLAECDAQHTVVL